MLPIIKYHYDTNEALSICRLVWSLIVSDDSIKASEIDYFNELLQHFKLSEEAFNEVASDSFEYALEHIRKMPSKKRLECGTLLRLAVTSDGSVDKPELAQLNAILEKAAIFRLDPSGSKRQSEGGF
jgi:uncharacterized tellurite resistance protein B-like protein